ncbi:bromodomain-containing protein homolog isoform X1 [Culex pipiens pallens]|uniref:bromodomain-containing protein homolog isoform X1 n=1 Tax=Culex pipiens pallens TaxID=42434 RepID=UPI0019548061|nr:bromodomain-containing protein homolog isoform X1 [Culex pipiens pallens]
MGLDFEVQDYIKTLNKNCPPFKCPKCEKKYKSVVGLQYHLKSFDHDNPPPGTPPAVVVAATVAPVPAVAEVASPAEKDGEGGEGGVEEDNIPEVAPEPVKSEKPAVAKPEIGDTPVRRPPASTNKKSHKKKVGTPKNNKAQQVVARESLTYVESDGLIKIEFGGKNINIPVDEEFGLVSIEETRAKLLDPDTEMFAVPPPTEPEVKLPEGIFKEMDDYTICDAPARPTAYIRFIEKSTEELDGEVEYDVDEEDTTWLGIINEKRAGQNLAPVPVDSLELLMDRLEKESYFQAAVTGGQNGGAIVDDDAVCCICMDGECQNTNVILFCDMCNLAVHQDCYGVPYIPEGQWLCRRCLQSPSRSVDCVLCPNTGGAFKQTDQNQWAHVVCALWIPEVRFANTVFLEPIDSIETIPAARWRLVCYICKQKGIGACIQCNRSSCYAAFHVTCAQQAGLCMRMDQVRGNDTHPVVVQKTAYCDTHTPINALGSPGDSGGETDPREICREKMKKARKMLAMKRTSAPVILIPTIPTNRVDEISSLVNITKKPQFIQRLIAYWTLKRQHRNGVPLLRRLQSQGPSQSAPPLPRDKSDGSPDARELYQQLKYWQCLRQDLERARLLCELVRKREKLKLILIKTNEQCVMTQLNPIESTLHRILDQLEAKDAQEIFREPVDTEEVHDYLDIVKHPMDLGTMRQKLKSGHYCSIEDLEADFLLMCNNCLTYNNKDTMFYRAGVKMKDAGTIIFRTIRKELERAGILEKPHPQQQQQQAIAAAPVPAPAVAPTPAPAPTPDSEDSLAVDIESEVALLAQEPPSLELIEKMQQQMTKAGGIKHGLSRSKRVKLIRAEIAKVKRALAREPDKIVAAVKEVAAPVMPEVPVMETPKKQPSEPTTSTAKSPKSLQTPPASPLKILNNSPSPSGVNRRTAVLFTRKAQAALKKPETPSKEETVIAETTELLLQAKSTKKTTRGKRSSGKSSSSSQSKQLGEPGFLGLPGPSGSSSGRRSGGGDSGEKKSFEAIPDSFRVYRGGQDREISDSDDSNLSFTGSTCSSCSGFSGSGTESEFGSSSDDGSFCDTEMSTSETEPFPEKPLLEPLKLVWAKCRGYPWYPALIIDPDIPTGFVHNGVPLPAPPADVLALKANYPDEQVFLVLFFDAKRTWQWLPAAKLELLGVNKELDQSKLVESRKPTERKAVNKAYQEALHYHSQVSSADGPAGKL